MLISLVKAVDCLALSTFLYILFAFRDHRRRRGFPYPPGPPPLPAIGNLLDVPMLSPWLGYANMSKKYGDVVCLQIFGQVVIVLCSPTAIKDLFDKRGELMDVDWLFPLSRTGKYWREGRRLLDRSLRPGATALHRHFIEERTHAFLGQLLATPMAFRKHLHLLVQPPRYPITADSHCSLQGKIVMRLTYGYDLKENDDMSVPPKRVVEIMTQFVLPGAALSGASLRGFLGSSTSHWQREGTAVPSLATEYLQEADLLGGLERQQAVQGIEDILGSLFQEVQKRAQAELDSVISRDRLPTYDDRPHLPYIEAMSKELMRWRMVTPLVYKGYFIPKGAVVVANGWAVLHDPEPYPDPEAFNPDRFLNEDGTFRDDPMISLAFGAGRRICPARHLVDVILFVVTASVLSVFNVTRAKDKDGNEIPVAVPPLDSILPDLAVAWGCCIKYSGGDRKVTLYAPLRLSAHQHLTNTLRKVLVNIAIGKVQYVANQKAFQQTNSVDDQFIGFEHNLYRVENPCNLSTNG
ncbi:cytochrome P450 [Lactarius pseudohatsudake]|nr:cytochrome P450 [Lactarius pseudohatsudake]